MWWRAWTLLVSRLGAGACRPSTVSRSPSASNARGHPPKRATRASVGCSAMFGAPASADDKAMLHLCKTHECELTRNQALDPFSDRYHMRRRQVRLDGGPVCPSLKQDVGVRSFRPIPFVT